MSAPINTTDMEEEVRMDENGYMDLSGSVLREGLPSVFPDGLPAELTGLEMQNCRLTRLEALDKCTRLVKLVARQNLLTTLENLDNLTALEHLDVYDNQITRLEGLDNLSNLTYLDVSFNNMPAVENIAHLTKLTQLFVISNRITQIPEPSQLAAVMPNLTMLEFGSNKLRRLENLCRDEGDTNEMANLTLRNSGRNKITRLDGLRLPMLRILSIQSNRITRIENLDQCPNLEELYLSHNGIKQISGLEPCTRRLRVLDVDANLVEALDEDLPAFERLEELWIGNNKLSDWRQLQRQLARMPSTLTALYLIGNPLSKNAQYVNRVTAMLPQLEELDGNPVLRRSLLLTDAADQDDQKSSS